MPIRVLNSGIVSPDEDEAQKSRNDRKAYPDAGVDYRKKGNLVSNAVARTTGEMASVEPPDSKFA